MLQTLKVLGNHAVFIIGPENIDYSEYKEIGFKGDQVIRMRADHFKDIAAYNKMLCAAWFYRTFKVYEYIFIMQNDAWVFRDELDMWCSMGYDYIGSPWLWKPEQTKAKVWIELFPIMKGEIGNGGVSLRRTKTFISLSWVASTIYSLIKKNEDFLWLLVSKLPLIKIKKPTIDDALRFCIEMEPEQAMEMIGGEIPFTVHAYERYGKDFWRKYIR